LSCLREAVSTALNYVKERVPYSKYVIDSLAVSIKLYVLILLASFPIAAAFAAVSAGAAVMLYSAAIVLPYYAVRLVTTFEAWIPILIVAGVHMTLWILADVVSWLRTPSPAADPVT